MEKKRVSNTDHIDFSEDYDVYWHIVVEEEEEEIDRNVVLLSTHPES